MKNIWSTDCGIYLGYPSQATEGEPPELKKPLRYTGDRHLFTVGPNGTGKTKRLLVPSLHDLTGWSCVVNDVKGELCAMTAAHRRAKGSEIIVLNPFNVLDIGSTGFNPIAALELNDDFPDDALELAEAVIRIEGREPHWPQAAQEFVAGIIMYVRLVIPNGSFADVRSLLALSDGRMRRFILAEDDFVFKGMQLPGALALAENTGWEEMAVKLERFGDITPENREMHSVISTALTQTRWLDSRPVKRDLGGPSFDFSVLKDRPATVYLILPARRLATHSAWLRLMLASMVQKLMKDTRRSNAPVLFMLDEYYAIAEGDGFPVIARNMAMFRGYGVKLWTVWQDLAQAERLYEKGFESFLSNAGVVQAFAPQDITTAEYISKRTGQTTRQFLTHNQSRQPNPAMPGGMFISSGSNENLIPMPLMLPQDVRNMDDGFSVLFSHKEKGTVRSYAPWPGDLKHLREIMARDPAN
jgi:type IV secretion system protein VirD4